MYDAVQLQVQNGNNGCDNSVVCCPTCSWNKPTTMILQQNYFRIKRQYCRVLASVAITSCIDGCFKSENTPEIVHMGGKQRWWSFYTSSDKSQQTTKWKELVGAKQRGRWRPRGPKPGMETAASHAAAHTCGISCPIPSQKHLLKGNWKHFYLRTILGKWSLERGGPQKGAL